MTRYTPDEIAALLGLPAPTAEQAAVIEAPLEPVLVVAGAGSGKTETMSARVVYLVANGLVEPDEVLGLTFTRKAAGELAERIRRRLRTLAARLRADGVAHSLEDGVVEAMRRPTVSTYNSYAAGLVKEHALRLGIEPSARLLGEASGWQLAHEVVETWTGELQTGAALSTIVNAVRELSGSLSEHLLSPADARAQMQQIVGAIEATPAGNGRSEHLAPVKALLGLMRERIELVDLVDELARRKRVGETLDFGDQVALGARLAEDFDAVGELERARYRVVLLDEYQDTSYAQARMLGALFHAGHAVTAVGDPNQSIYGWRGASASGLSRFAEQFDAVGRVHHLALSTSWRNDLAILDASNAVARPLRDRQVGIDVPALGARPGAGRGAVSAVYAPTLADEAIAVADFVQEHWRPSMSGRSARTAAVLCRARKQFVDIEIELRRRGIPVEVVGLGGLLDTPEVVDLVAFLEVVHDPARGDSLMRLLTGPWLNLGAADAFAVADRMRELARSSRVARGRQGDPGADDAHVDGVVPEADIVDSHSIVDVLDELPPPGWRSLEGRELSGEARARLTRLADVLAHVRSRTYLSVPEIVGEAEQALGLDIEVALAGGHGRGRAALDAFRDIAVRFVDGAPVPTLGAFLAWLDAARQEERGLDQPLSEPDPQAVQIITVHAAKGLEWDVVAVPGLSDGTFPSTRTVGDGYPRDSAWLTGLGTLPYPLRGDAPDLPELRYAGANDPKDLDARRKEFLSVAGQHQVAEERRLAYVALTRARSHLLLAGSWFRTGATPVPPSPFLTELVDAGLVPGDTVSEEPADGDVNPRLTQETTATWPAQAPAGVDLRRDAAELVVAASPAAWEDLAVGAAGDLARTALRLLDEREERRRPRREVELPAHLSASSMVRLAKDRAAYAQDLRRPVPQEPSVHARRGTTFHAWVEQFYGAPVLLDLDELVGADDDATDQDLETLKAAFLASEWAGLEPVAVEVDVETPVAGIMTRSRIDAVFADPRRLGGVVVVDWKTGKVPTDTATARAREVQLAVYRLAWARWTRMPLEDVDAAFFYVGSGATVRPTSLASAEELDQLVRGEPAEG